MIIRSKSEFFALWEKGILGNRPQLFRDPIQAWRSGVPYIGFRQLGKTGGGLWTRVPRSEFWRTVHIWNDLNISYIMDSALYPTDDSHITLEGEICRTYRGLEGLMGFCKGFSMRAAIKAGLLKPRSGAEVLVMLNRWMDPSSQDDLRDLLDLYPDATIEFTCFDVDVGIIPGRSTIFWEVRGY
jgi:hypothetical protein